MTATTSHLHTPRINRVDVFDEVVYSSLDTFLKKNSSYTDGMIRFIPPGYYTISDGAIGLPTDGLYSLKGAGGRLFGIDGSAFGDTHGYSLGSTEIACTDNVGLFSALDTASITYVNLLSFEDLNFSQDPTLSSDGTAFLDLIRAHYLYIDRCSFKQYGGNGGTCIYSTGSYRVSIKDTKISGFGPANADVSMWAATYFRLCDVVNISNFDYTNYSNPCAGVFSFYDCHSANLSNLDIGAVGVVSSKSYFIKTTGSIHQTICVNGAHFDNWVATSTQRGMMNIGTAYSTIMMDGIYFGCDDLTLPESNNANVGRVLVRGYPAQGSGDVTLSVGVVAAPFDSSYYMITPRAISSASAPVASTNYTASMRVCEMAVKGGTGVVPTISGAARSYNAASGTNYMLYPGDVVNFGAFTVAPTVSCKFFP